MSQSKRCFNTELVGCCLTLNVSSRLLFNVKRVKNVFKNVFVKNVLNTVELHSAGQVEVLPRGEGLAKVCPEWAKRSELTSIFVRLRGYTAHGI